MQEQQDVMDECERAAPLLQALLNKPCHSSTPNTDECSTTQLGTSGDPYSCPTSPCQEGERNIHGTLQNRLDIVESTSAQASARIKDLEASLHDHRTSLHAVQVRAEWFIRGNVQSPYVLPTIMYT
jgi:hypothetical protein